jgi:dihydroneopterin aldolase
VRIEVTSQKIYAFHGCLPEEALIGSPYVVDLAVEVSDERSAQSDELSDTVDYVLLARIAREEMAQRAELLETVAPGDDDDETPEVEDKDKCRNAWSAHLTHQQEIANASAEVATCAVEWAKCQEAAKSAKKKFEGAVEDLRSIIGRGPEVLPLFDQQPTKQPETQEQPGTDTDDPETRDRWRAIPIDEICFGIKGMGAKKLEAMRDAIPTLGSFEDLRKKASLEGNPLREYMPKGIGQEACDQLEEAALNRISQEYGDDDDDDDADDGGDGGDDDDE